MKFSYSVLQINTQKDTNNHAFMPSDFLINHKGTCFPPPKDIYDEVYHSEQSEFSPPQLFLVYNEYRPMDYKARSLSISDIIRYDLPNGKHLHLFCDHVGFTPIDIDENHKFAKEPQFIPSADSKSGVVVLTYETDSGVREVRINPDDLHRGKNFGLNEIGQMIELTPAEILQVIYVHGKYKSLVRRQEDIKTLKGWQKSGLRTFMDYVVPGDKVNDDTVNYFINISPPVTCYSTYVQVGEAYDHFRDESGNEQPCYLTFKRENNVSNWFFLGICKKCGSENLYMEKTWNENFIELLW